MEYGSLFTGIGGFDLALMSAGFTPAWMCEIDKNCQNILNRHFEGVKLYEDIKDIDGSVKPVDIIVGGFPCQDLSVAGKREGLAGERSGLWYEFARVIDLVEPKWVVIENVPGLSSSDKGRDFAIIIRWLVERGYGVCWRVLDSRYFGVAQRRRRMFIVASFGSGSCAQVLFEPESEPRNNAKSREKGESSSTYAVRRAQTNSNGIGVDTIAHSLDGTGGDAVTSTLRGFGHGWQGQHNDTNSVIVEQNNDVTTPDMISLKASRSHPLVCGAVSSKWAKQSGGPAGDEAYNLVIDQKETFQNTGHGYWQNDNISQSLRGSTGAGNHESNLVSYSPFSHYGYKEADESATLQDRENRINGSTNLVVGYENHPNDSRVTETGTVSQQLTSRMGTGGNNVPLVQKTQSGVRRLTPTECERLQGFPDGWTDGQSDSTRYRQLGNAVTVNTVYWIMKRIMETENGR